MSDAAKSDAMPPLAGLVDWSVGGARAASIPRGAHIVAMGFDDAETARAWAQWLFDVPTTPVQP